MLKNKRWLWVGMLGLLLIIAVYILLFAPLIPLSLNAAHVPTAEYLLQNPASKPEFVSFPKFPATCAMKFSLSQYRPTGSPIRDNFTLIIDGVQVQYSPYLLGATGGALSCTGEYPNLLCQDNITFCYDKKGLNEGLHLVEVSLTDPDGVEHTYSWAFRYDPNLPTSDPNVLPTLAPLPSETPSPIP